MRCDRFSSSLSTFKMQVVSAILHVPRIIQGSVKEIKYG